MLSALKVQVTQVVIHDLQDNTFYAEVHLKRGNKTYQIDARPSDAIALAIRTKSPIYVTGNVIEAMVEEPSEEEREEVERFRKLLEDVDLGEDEPEEE
jgi:bifunctional DNase/RNase